MEEYFYTLLYRRWLNPDFRKYVLHKRPYPGTFRSAMLKLYIPVISLFVIKSNPHTKQEFIEAFLDSIKRYIPFYAGTDEHEIWEIYKFDMIKIYDRTMNELIQEYQFDENGNKPRGVPYSVEEYLNQFKKNSVRKDKRCNSQKRAVAFCLMEMFYKGKISSEVLQSKKQIINVVQHYFPEQSGKTVYQALRTDEGIYFAFESCKKIYSEDYNCGLDLYKALFPD